MATHVALAGFSLSSMSGRLLLLVLVLALVGLLLAKRARDGRAAGQPEDDAPVETHDDEPSQAEWEASVTRPSLRSRLRASRSAFVDPGEAQSAVQDESPRQHDAPPPAPAPAPAPVPAPALVGATAAPAAQQAAAPQPPAPAAPPAQPTAPRPAAPTHPGLFAPVPPGSVAAGGRAPGATILPKL